VLEGGSSGPLLALALPILELALFFPLLISLEAMLSLLMFLSSDLVSYYKTLLVAMMAAFC
jgi:hypothetical protein